MSAGMLVLAGPAAAAEPTVTEVGGPGAGISDTTFQSGIAPAPDGKLWFIEQVHGRIGAIEPFGGTVAEHAAPDGLSGIGVGPDGNFYFGINPLPTFIGQSWIGNGKTSNGTLAQGFYGGGSHAEPHYPVAGPEGRIWVTQPGDDSLGLIDLATPPTAPTILGAFGAPNLTPGSDPETIVGGPADRSSNPSGALWFTEFSGNRIGRATPVSCGLNCSGALIDEYSVPISAAKPEGTTLGPDGNIWFTEFGKDAVGRLIPPATFGGTPSIQSFPLAAGSTPIGIAAGPDGNLWVAETGKSKIARVSTSGVVTGEYPTGGAPPIFIAAGADGRLWATETGSTTVARIDTGLDAPQFRSAVPIPIDPGASDPPPTLNVSGLTGTISKVTVRLTGISHNFPDDMDLLLQAPNGQTVALASDVGSLENTAPKRSWPANGVTLTLDDAAAAPLSDIGPLVSGIYKPTNEEGNSDSEDGLDNVTPVSSNFPSSLATLNGGDPNGAWKLWVIDDTGGDTGTIFGGWGLDIQTTAPPPPPGPPAPPAPAPVKKCKKPKKKTKAAMKKFKKCKKRLKKHKK